MEKLSSQKSKSRMRFFNRRTSSIGSNVSFKSVGSTFSFSGANSGSRDESFFESQLTFESDADEDFQSVHEGDSVTSETATPNNNTTTASSDLSKSTSLKLNASSDNAKETPPSSDQKVKLIDLLIKEQEITKQERETESSKTGKIEKLLSIASRASSADETPPTQSKIMRNRSFKAVPCCVPCLSFNSSVSRKKKTDTSS